MKHAIVGSIVGFHGGWRGVLDTDQPCGFNRLDPACRECQVFPGEEHPGDVKALGLAGLQALGGWTQITQLIHIIGLE